MCFHWRWDKVRLEGTPRRYPHLNSFSLSTCSPVSLNRWGPDWVSSLGWRGVGGFELVTARLDLHQKSLILHLRVEMREGRRKRIFWNIFFCQHPLCLGGSLPKFIKYNSENSLIVVAFLLKALRITRTKQPLTVSCFQWWELSECGSRFW